MKKNRELLKTNLLVSIILVCGFMVTAFLSYQANYEDSLDKIEQVASLTTEGIYYQLSALFTKPINISLTMAHDSLLADHLENEADHLEDEAYAWTIKNYLETYRNKYEFDSVFLVSALTNRYYNFNGIDRILLEGEPENEWYFGLLDDQNLEYSMNVDNDEVSGADNAITVFVNCKIYGENEELLGVVGVGMRVSYLKEFLQYYEETYNLKVCLVDKDGGIEISSEHTGYNKTDWFQYFGHEQIRSRVLSWQEDTANLEVWTDTEAGSQEKSYVVTRYVPEVGWHLIVEQNNGAMVKEIKLRLYQTGFLIAAIIIIVLIVITTVLSNFNQQITQLIEERQGAFKRATEELYDNINEFNITKNCYANRLTEQYFDNAGAGNLPYDQGIKVIAEKQIKEEYRAGYVSTFAPDNVIREYENGNNHLSYDFMLIQDDGRYVWMRIDAYIFFFQEDECIHMFTYRKNIEAEKKKELMAATDEMTGFLTKSETERKITALLAERAEEVHAFFLLDIDNFKQVNDSCGHAFGDHCIREFTSVIKNHFSERDILGRIGGDEFVVFITVPDAAGIEKKAKELSKALQMVCSKDNRRWNLSASIGISLAPRDGTDFDELYQKADAALYRTKKRGKNGYTIY